MFAEKDWEKAREAARRLGAKLAKDVLLVSVGEQKVRHYRDGRCVREYACSTSKKPPSCIEGSGGTPRGLHEVAEKYGAGEPEGMVFVGRRPKGYRWWEDLTNPGNAEPRITSRILWLRGLEPGLNAGEGIDTYKRYIYFHGTNFTDRIGTPASGGCVLLRDAEMIELFEEISEGASVWIEWPEGLI